MPITVKRVSDGKTFTVADANEHTTVAHLKKELKAQFPPRLAHGLYNLRFNWKWYVFYYKKKKQN